MADKVAFELVSPTRLLYSDAVDMVVVPGSEGDFGVLPGHAPLISLVRPGVIDIHDGGKVGARIFVAGGFAEVVETRCTVLAEEAVPVADIDRAEAESRLSAARAAAGQAQTEPERAAAERRILVAEALVEAARPRT
ncbi:MAG TPA: F0F1 ATP synthase subunit epsilon [Alphaproteobacteria bacterium]|jgi:F-type H+-transporting ATPase subunit epsilon